jgi:hypothetical protein
VLEESQSKETEGAIVVIVGRPFSLLPGSNLCLGLYHITEGFGWIVAADKVRFLDLESYASQH